MDKERIYTVITLQATGKDVRHHRILKIGLARIENGEVIDRFISLVDPEQAIPEYIMSQTGIDERSVRMAPNFAEIANRVDVMLRNSVLVGHQVSWSYHALRSEFRHLGYNLDAPKICTQHLAKKLLPSLFSYEFDKLCSSLAIPLINRTYIEDILDATSILFQRLLSLDEDSGFIAGSLAPKIIGQRLPSRIDADTFTNLPTTPGIYQFQDSDGKIIYVGKAKNIKKRVLSHFFSQSVKEKTLCEQTYSIDFEETGNEFMALLLEAELIKKLEPYYNTIQKKLRTTYHIKAHSNKSGILQFAIEEKPQLGEDSELFFTKASAKKKLEQLCGDFNLCPKYAGLQRKKGRCDHAKFPFCAGVCFGNEQVYVYNKRATAALTTLIADTDSYYIRERGRRTGEVGVTLVLQGVYQGFGYIDSSQQISNIDELQDLIEPRKSTYHTTQILAAFRKKFPYKVNYIDRDFQ